MEHIKIVLSIF